MNPRTFLFWALASLTFAAAAAGSPMPATSSATATFVRMDTTTQGTWKNVYGTDGYSVADTSPSKIPSYATFTPENQANYTWTTNGGQTWDLEVAWASPTDVRQASCWYTYYSNSFDLNVNFTDGNAHELALYALDWDSQGRVETVQVTDANTNAVLDTRTLSNFTNGVYLIWNISGHVKVNVTKVSGTSAVISAALFAPPASTNTTATATASFVQADTTTEGNWQGTYGGDGYSIANDLQSLPSYSTFAVQNQQNYTWAATTSDVRALESGVGSARIASTWDGAPQFNFDVNFTDGKTHQLALYALDWDSYLGTRVETIQILDATTGALIDSRALLTFVNGTYLVWNVSGHVKINVILNSAGNAVISGVFFGTGTPGTVPTPVATSPTTTPTATAPTVTAPVTITSSAASFVTSDTASEGTWRGKYGSDGYSIANDSQNLPSYATFAVQNQQNYTWALNTNDLRALQSGSGSGRIAATWFSNSSFDFDINLTDGKSHQIALYGLDWDDYDGGRAEKIQIVDAGSGTVLDTRTISGFTNGIYLIWNVSGHVRVNVVLTGNGNAVISGVFFGGATAGVTAPATVTATQPVSLSVTPTTVTLSQGQTQTFIPTVQNSTNMSVTWAISPNVGTVSSSGIYTAPATITATQTVTVTASTVATPAATAAATVTLAPPAAVSTTPTTTPSTPATSLPSGLVLHWTFDTATISGNTVTDTSNNGGNGTLQGNPAVVAGELGQALSFNGVNSLVSMYAYGDRSTQFANSVTLSAWINTTNASRAEAIISKYSAAGSGNGYVFRTDSAGHVELMVGAGDLSAYPGTVTDTTVINNGQWHHVVAVVNMGQNVQFYVDGTLRSTFTMYTLPNGDGWSNLEVGSSSYVPFGNYFTGSIDEVQVYNRALTAAEVNSVYTLTGGGKSQTPTTQTQVATASTQLAVAQGTLMLAPSSFSFGTVTIGNSSTQSFTVLNSGSGGVTISNVSLSGPGLTATGISTGMTLAAGQSATLSVTFAPASTGASTGSVTITSNATNASTAISLTGTGAQPAPIVHSIMLSWAPSSSSTVVGYDVYRGTSAAGPFTLITVTPVATTSFTDTTGQIGQTYYYVVTSVDSSNVQSSYSNVVSATIP